VPSGTALAVSSYQTAFTTKYQAAYQALYLGQSLTISVCNLCHDSVQGAPALNQYGSAFLNSGHNFTTIEALDSDGDGVSNLSEIMAFPETFPGDSTSHPVTDSIKPLVTVFTIPADVGTLTVPITALDATDDIGVTGYMVTESANTPLAEATGWATSKPVNYTFTNAGVKTLFVWAKDAAGNVSVAVSATTTITFVAPSVVATATVGTGGSVTPNSSTVNSGSTASFPVSTDAGYTRSNTVGGTCPEGSWNGDTYTTGAITSDCSVSFSFSVSTTCSQNSIDWVNKSYVAYYGRPADPAGLDYWACRMDAEGGNLSSIINAFGISAEFDLRYGSQTNEQLIDNIYHQMFNRDPDTGGKAWYLAKLENGEMNLQTITLDVLGGATGTDSDIIVNKLEVASYFTDQLRATQGSYDSINDARDIMSNVGATSNSRDSAKNDFDSLINSWDDSLVGTPISITILGSDPDGSYPVSWGASATDDVNYELEEATNSSFTTGNRTAYTGTNLSTIIDGRTAGLTYYYRVKAIKDGMTDSAWQTGADSCTVLSESDDDDDDDDESTEVWSFTSADTNYNFSLAFNKDLDGIISVSGPLSYYDPTYYMTVTGTPTGTATINGTTVTMSLSAMLQSSIGLSLQCDLFVEGTFNNGEATVDSADVSCPSLPYSNNSSVLIYGTRSNGSGITP